MGVCDSELAEDQRICEATQELEVVRHEAYHKEECANDKSPLDEGVDASFTALDRGVPTVEIKSTKNDSDPVARRQRHHWIVQKDLAIASYLCRVRW